jgi:hypothetical protein
VLEASHAPASALTATSAATLAVVIVIARKTDPAVGGRLTRLRHTATTVVPPAAATGPVAGVVQVSSNVGLPLAGGGIFEERNESLEEHRGG